MNDKLPLPRWTPAIGKRFKARVLGIDSFLNQYNLQNADDEPLSCDIKDDTVTVEKGEQFTVATFASLHLDKFIGEEVAVVATGSRSMPAHHHGESERTIWMFNVFIPPESKMRLVTMDTVRANRAVVRGLMISLLDESIAAGELIRMIRSVRQSVRENDKTTLYPEGPLGTLANQLAQYLLGEDNSFDKPEPEDEDDE